MIFKVENLGRIKEAEVDLNKDLILLTGQNNTGKTYLAYAIYGFLEKNIVTEGILTTRTGTEVKTENSIKVDLESLADSYFHEYELLDISDFEDLFQTDNIFRFINSKSSCQPSNIEYIKKKLYESTNKDINFKAIAELLKQKNCYDLEIDIRLYHNMKDNFTDEHEYRHCEYFIKKVMFPSNNILFFPAERSAINIFIKELTINKNQFLEFTLKMPEKLRSEFLNFLQKKVNRYPEPININLRQALDLLPISKYEKSQFSHLAYELEKEILGGEISVSEYEDLRFKPENSDISPLETHLTGSMIKSLAGLSFYLRHSAQKYDCLIIDEPEMNLHPDNQRKIARFFGRLINEGFKVIISTHSDYIIKEINNLVMLSKESEAQKELLEKYNYAENELIKPERIEALLFRKTDGNEQITPTKIEVNETGLSVETIDEVIDELDNTAERIYFQLFENQ